MDSKGILVVLLFLAGMYFVIFPGERARYWSQDDLYEISFEVVNDSWCYWEVSQIGGSYYDDGYMQHAQILPASPPIPRLECDLYHDWLTVSSPDMSLSKDLFLSIIRK